LIRVLVADDHPVVREGLLQLLEQQNDIRVVAKARNGQEALVLLKRFEPDVTVLDWYMPELSGLEAARQILRERPGYPVVMFTLDDDVRRAAEAFRVGVRGFVVKADDNDQLVTAIRKVSAGGTFYTVAQFQGRCPVRR